MRQKKLLKKSVKFGLNDGSEIVKKVMKKFGKKYVQLSERAVVKVSKNERKNS